MVNERCISIKNDEASHLIFKELSYTEKNLGCQINIVKFHVKSCFSYKFAVYSVVWWGNVFQTNVKKTVKCRYFYIIYEEMHKNKKSVKLQFSVQCINFIV